MTSEQISNAYKDCGGGGDVEERGEVQEVRSEGSSVYDLFVAITGTVPG